MNKLTDTAIVRFPTELLESSECYSHRWSFSSSCGSCPVWLVGRWPDSAGLERVEPPLDGILAALQNAPQSTLLTGPCNTWPITRFWLLYMQWGHIHFFHLNLYINRNAIKSLKCLWFCTNRNHISTNNAIFHETYLSTESNGRLSGGGRALTFLGGASLSPWDWGGAGSDPEGGGNGEGGRDSFHSAWVEQKN